MVAGTAFAATKDIPCEVRLEFSTDPAIGQVVSYTLSVQVKNTSPQPITAVSLLWLDEDGKIIGNSGFCRERFRQNYNYWKTWKIF